MSFLIADTFTDSLARLTGEEQKAAKTTAFDLQINPANPGLSFHKLDKVRDKSFWSVRVSGDIRLIVHKTDASLLLCYVDRLLGSVVTDVDGNTEDRSDTASVFNGPPPVICTLKDEGEEIKTIGKWIAERA